MHAGCGYSVYLDVASERMPECLDFAFLPLEFRGWSTGKLLHPSVGTDLAQNHIKLSVLEFC